MSQPEQATSAHPPWKAARRILLLIAHPDDEVVGCCAAIGRARAAGAKVFGLVLTTGVPARDVLWPWDRHRHGQHVARRRDECRAVAALLGLSGMAFLDLPARGLRGALLDVRKQVLETIAWLRVETVWAPAYEGGHTDHDSASMLAASLPEGPGKADVTVYEYAEYNFLGGTVRSQTFPATLGPECILELSAEEAQLKRQALARYSSAQGDLVYVGVGREAFRPIAAYDYSRPPHEGKLFYQRFQWVFFRHPRVDFTQPAEVCRDLLRFRSSLAAPAQ